MNTRIYFLDHLRTLMIFFVVVLHAGLVYERVLPNHWIVVDPVSVDSIGLIRMYLDLFVMFIIFFISGYLTPLSLKGKTDSAFVQSKIKRILLPWGIAVLTLIPAYKFIFLHARDLPQQEWYSYFHFFARTGNESVSFADNPVQNWLWFLPVLFVFQMAYLMLAKTKVLKLKISLKAGILFTFLVGAIYGVAIAQLGLTGWYESWFLHFQRERLLIYFVAFLLGTLCFKLKVLENAKRNRRQYIYGNIVVTVAISVFTAVALNLFFNMINPERNFYFISLFGDRVLYYSFTLLAQLSILYVLVYAFKFSFNKTNVIVDELNRNSYAVYIIHLVIAGVLAIPLLGLQIPSMVKFVLLLLLTFILSNMLIYSYRLTIKKQFNMKTLSTAVLTVLIVFAVFKTYPERNVKDDQNIAVETSSNTTGKSIHAAVIAGDLETVKQLIAAGVDINEKEPAGGSSPLISACVFDQTEVALFLIESGADLDFINNEGSTALHTAAFFCRTEIVKTLLEKGADKSIINKSGATAEMSVLAPFEGVKGIYEYFEKVFEPLGLKLDLYRIEETRPVIAEMLK